MRLAATVIVALLLPGAMPAAADDATLRVDYYHTGDRDTEIFSLERVVREPLPWSGNAARPLDETRRGKYLFEIVPDGSSSPAYTRSFSSIYGEWETTGEARRMHRSFHESLRFPDPGRPFNLVIRKRNAANGFDEIWNVSIDPSDYLVHEESADFAEQVVGIQNNGDPRNKVDLLILGDGYTAAETDAFLRQARDLTDALFSMSPFRERRDDFNVWALAPIASQSGVSRPSTGFYTDSPLGATYDAFRSERYVLTYENRTLRRIASSAPYDFIEILANSETYGGGGIYGLYGTAAAGSEWAEYLFIHEFAHHFAGLADEYYTSSVAYEAPGRIVEPYEPNVTALLDPNNLKWQHLVHKDTPLPTPWPKAAFDRHSIAYQQRRAKMREQNVPEADMNRLFREDRDIVEAIFADAPYSSAIGAFEGALYQSSGYYRSEMNCIMFTRTDYFCRVCSDALEAVIDEYVSGGSP